VDRERDLLARLTELHAKHQALRLAVETAARLIWIAPVEAERILTQALTINETNSPGAGSTGAGDR
jgi:hypothetical protein